MPTTTIPETIANCSRCGGASVILWPNGNTQELPPCACVNVTSDETAAMLRRAHGSETARRFDGCPRCEGDTSATHNGDERPEHRTAVRHNHADPAAVLFDCDACPRVAPCEDGRHFSPRAFYGTNEVRGGACSRCGTPICGQRANVVAFCVRNNRHDGEHANLHTVRTRSLRVGRVS